jgi:hypothetical protein
MPPRDAVRVRDRKSNRTAAGVRGTVASKKGALQGLRGPAGRPAGRKPPLERALWRGLAGARAQRVPRVARRLRDQPTGDGHHCSRWSKTYTGCGWARTFQSGTASLAGSSQAGGPRAGLIRGGPPGSPMWLRIRRTGLGRGLCPPCHPLAAGALRPAPGHSPTCAERPLDPALRSVPVLSWNLFNRPVSVVAWTPRRPAAVSQSRSLGAASFGGRTRPVAVPRLSRWGIRNAARSDHACTAAPPSRRRAAPGSAGESPPAPFPRSPRRSPTAR